MFTRNVLNERRKKKRRRIVFFILIPLLLLISAGVFYGATLYNDFKQSMEFSYEAIEGREKSPIREEAVKIDKDNFSVLIMGIDDSEKRGFGENSRTDALMLATVNQDERSVKLLSIPRDSYVYIPEVGYETRINHAHAFGGPKATIETVENLFEVPIDYYVSVNFNVLIDVVDALGGINIEVPYAFSEQDSKDRAGAIQLEAGPQILNGEEALALARTRKLDNDIERGKRQQEIIKSVISRAASVGSISKYDDVFESVGSNMKTDLVFGEIKYLAEFGIKDSLTIESLTLSGEDYWGNGGAYYYKLDESELENTKTALQNHLDHFYAKGE